MKRSKKYRESEKLVDRDKVHTALEAAALAKKTTTVKFDATIEVSMALGVDPKKADQMVRGTVLLPHGTGKTARVIVFANADKAAPAKAEKVAKVKKVAKATEPKAEKPAVKKTAAKKKEA